MSQLLPQSPPKLRDIFDAFKSEIAKEINCILPGIIQGFDMANQTATIQIAVKKILNVALDGTQTYAQYPVLQEVPVMILTGGSGHLTFPIAAGDSCIVLFNDRDIENWFLTGQASVPNSGRLHDKSDAFAIVGIRHSQNAIQSYFSGTQLQHDENTKIEFTAGNIKITGNVEVTGSLQVDGIESGESGTLNLNSNLVQSSGKSIHAGNGANGTFSNVTVVDGIVISGT